MKILITTDLYTPTVNGVVASVLNLKKELQSRGHEVKILTTSDRVCSYREGDVYSIMSVPFPVYQDVRMPISRGQFLVEELIEWKPDVVHSQCEFFSFEFAKKIARETGAVLIHTYHTLYEQYTEYLPGGKMLGGAALAGWMKLRLRNVDRIIAPTRKVEATLREYGLEQPIDIIPSGIELQRFAEEISPSALRGLRARYGIPEEAKVLLSLGRLGFEKRVEELIDGMNRLLGIRQDVCLLIVGDGPARESLEKKVQELHLERYVKFTGMVHPQETAMYYQLGDLFVCASTSETQGLTYIEAAASGLPLVCREDPCLVGVLENGENGYAYGEIDAFVQSVSRVLEDEEWRSRAGWRSRCIARLYGTEEFGKRVEQCYRKPVERGAVKKDEGIVVFKEQADRLKKWCWTCYDHARRIS